MSLVPFSYGTRHAVERKRGKKTVLEVTTQGVSLTDPGQASVIEPWSSFSLPPQALPKEPQSLAIGKKGGVFCPSFGSVSLRAAVAADVAMGFLGNKAPLDTVWTRAVELSHDQTLELAILKGCVPVARLPSDEEHLYVIRPETIDRIHQANDSRGSGYVAFVAPSASRGAMPHHLLRVRFDSVVSRNEYVGLLSRCMRTLRGEGEFVVDDIDLEAFEKHEIDTAGIPILYTTSAASASALRLLPGTMDLSTTGGLALDTGAVSVGLASTTAVISDSDAQLVQAQVRGAAGDQLYDPFGAEEGAAAGVQQDYDPFGLANTFDPFSSSQGASAYAPQDQIMNDAFYDAAADNVPTGGADGPLEAGATGKSDDAAELEAEAKQATGARKDSKKDAKDSKDSKAKRGKKEPPSKKEAPAKEARPKKGGEKTDGPSAEKYTRKAPKHEPFDLISNFVTIASASPRTLSLTPYHILEYSDSELKRAFPLNCVWAINVSGEVSVSYPPPRGPEDEALAEVRKYQYPLELESIMGVSAFYCFDSQHDRAGFIFSLLDALNLRRLPVIIRAYRPSPLLRYGTALLPSNVQILDALRDDCLSYSPGADQVVSTNTYVTACARFLANRPRTIPYDGKEKEMVQSAFRCLRNVIACGTVVPQAARAVMFDFLRVCACSRTLFLAMSGDFCEDLNRAVGCLDQLSSSSRVSALLFFRSVASFQWRPTQEQNGASYSGLSGAFMLGSGCTDALTSLMAGPRGSGAKARESQRIHPELTLESFGTGVSVHRDGEADEDLREPGRDGGRGSAASSQELLRQSRAFFRLEAAAYADRRVGDSALSSPSMGLPGSLVQTGNYAKARFEAERDARQRILDEGKPFLTAIGSCISRLASSIEEEPLHLLPLLGLVEDVVVTRAHLDQPWYADLLKRYLKELKRNPAASFPQPVGRRELFITVCDVKDIVLELSYTGRGGVARCASLLLRQLLTERNVLTEKLRTEICSAFVSSEALLHHLRTIMDTAESPQTREISCQLLGAVYVSSPDVQSVFSRVFPSALLAKIRDSPKLAASFAVTSPDQAKSFTEAYSGALQGWKDFARAVVKTTYSINLIWDGAVRAEVSRVLNQEISKLDTELDTRANSLNEREKEQILAMGSSLRSRLVSWNHQEFSINLRGFSDHSYTQYDVEVDGVYLSQLLKLSEDGLIDIIGRDFSKFYSKLFCERDFEHMVVAGKGVRAAIPKDAREHLVEQLYRVFLRTSGDEVEVRTACLYCISMIILSTGAPFKSVQELAVELVRLIHDGDLHTASVGLALLEIACYQSDRRGPHDATTANWACVARTGLPYALCCRVLPLVLYNGGAIRPSDAITDSSVMDGNTYGAFVSTALRVVRECVRAQPTVDAEGRTLVPIPRLKALLVEDAVLPNIVGLLLLGCGPLEGGKLLATPVEGEAGDDAVFTLDDLTILVDGNESREASRFPAENAEIFNHACQLLSVLGDRSFYTASRILASGAPYLALMNLCGLTSNVEVFKLIESLYRATGGKPGNGTPENMVRRMLRRLLPLPFVRLFFNNGADDAAGVLVSQSVENVSIIWGADQRLQLVNSLAKCIRPVFAPLASLDRVTVERTYLANITRFVVGKKPFVPVYSLPVPVEVREADDFDLDAYPAITAYSAIPYACVGGIYVDLLLQAKTEAELVSLTKQMHLDDLLYFMKHLLCLEGTDLLQVWATIENIGEPALADLTVRGSHRLIKFCLRKGVTLVSDVLKECALLEETETRIRRKIEELARKTGSTGLSVLQDEGLEHPDNLRRRRVELVTLCHCFFMVVTLVHRSVDLGLLHAHTHMVREQKTFPPEIMADFLALVVDLCGTAYEQKLSTLPAQNGLLPTMFDQEDQLDIIEGYKSSLAETRENLVRNTIYLTSPLLGLVDMAWKAQDAAALADDGSVFCSLTDALGKIVTKNDQAAVFAATPDFYRALSGVLCLLYSPHPDYEHRVEYIGAEGESAGESNGGASGTADDESTADSPASPESPKSPASPASPEAGESQGRKDHVCYKLLRSCFSLMLQLTSYSSTCGFVHSFALGGFLIQGVLELDLAAARVLLQHCANSSQSFADSENAAAQSLARVTTYLLTKYVVGLVFSSARSLTAEKLVSDAAGICFTPTVVWTQDIRKSILSSVTKNMHAQQLQTENVSLDFLVPSVDFVKLMPHDMLLGGELYLNTVLMRYVLNRISGSGEAARVDYDSSLTIPALEKDMPSSLRSYTDQKALRALGRFLSFSLEQALGDVTSFSASRFSSSIEGRGETALLAALALAHDMLLALESQAATTLNTLMDGRGGVPDTNLITRIFYLSISSSSTPTQEACCELAASITGYVAKHHHKLIIDAFCGRIGAVYGLLDGKLEIKEVNRLRAQLGREADAGIFKAACSEVALRPSEIGKEAGFFNARARAGEGKLLYTREVLMSFALLAMFQAETALLLERGAHLHYLHIFFQNLDAITYDSEETPDAHIIVRNAIAGLSHAFRDQFYDTPQAKAMRCLFPIQVRVAFKANSASQLRRIFVQSVTSPIVEVEFVWTGECTRDARELVARKYAQMMDPLRAEAASLSTLESASSLSDPASELLSAPDFVYEALPHIKETYTEPGDYVGGVFVTVYNEQSKKEKAMVSEPGRFITELYNGLTTLLRINSPQPVPASKSLLTTAASYIEALHNLTNYQPATTMLILTNRSFPGLIERCLLDARFRCGIAADKPAARELFSQTVSLFSVAGKIYSSDVANTFKSDNIMMLISSLLEFYALRTQSFNFESVSADSTTCVRTMIELMGEEEAPIALEKIFIVLCVFVMHNDGARIYLARTKFGRLPEQSTDFFGVQALYLPATRGKAAGITRPCRSAAVMLLTDMINRSNDVLNEFVTLICKADNFKEWITTVVKDLDMSLPAESYNPTTLQATDPNVSLPLPEVNLKSLSAPISTADMLSMPAIAQLRSRQAVDKDLAQIREFRISASYGSDAMPEDRRIQAFASAEAYSKPFMDWRYHAQRVVSIAGQCAVEGMCKEEGWQALADAAFQ